MKATNGILTRVSEVQTRRPGTLDDDRISSGYEEEIGFGGEASRDGAKENARPRIGDWIQTFTGGQAYPMDLRPSEIKIDDIAHSLAMQCRYTGHCLRFYSVAEHSVLVARWLWSNYGPVSALQGLLHDATEAYLTDVPRPVKPFLRGYREAEDNAQRAIAERFGVLPALAPEVKEADARILVDERSQNMAPSALEWEDMPSRGLDVTLQFWPPEQAEAAFLSCFWALIETGRM